MKKLLVICGPTATGKTSLALKLAKKFNGELISADSRQIYRGLDIGTGKDLLKIPEWVTVWGYDLAGPEEEFSVSKYIAFANKAIEDIWSREKLPILVGGTGLYIKAVVDGIPTALVPRNNALREKLKTKPPDELYEVLAQTDPIHAGCMNTSDRKNPRRLERAIEIAMWKLEDSRRSGVSVINNRTEKPDVLFVGLVTSKEKLFDNIEKRVDKRIAAGLQDEIKGLLSSGVTWEMQSMSSLGYRQWKEFFENTKSKEAVINDWKKEEKRYARRQITWFKKDKRLQWFDITEPKLQDNVEKLVKKWYKEDNGKEN